jgi:two-component system chemotaxis response regulator CheY
MKSLSEIKILVVDDMTTMRHFIITMLTEVGFTNTNEANDGITALPMIVNAHKEGTPYDIILSDWNMPEMSGIDLLKIIRSTKELEKMPFIMITMEAEQEYIEIAIKGGVNDFLVKPFTEKMLGDKIKKVFKLPID